MPPILMPDISHWQVGLTRARARLVATVAQAMMLKATQGSDVDPHFFANAAALTGILPWGAYCYVVQGDGAGQAETLAATATRRLILRHLSPAFLCIDWEEGDRSTALALAKRLRAAAPTLALGAYEGQHARANGGALPGLDFHMVPDYGPAARLPAQYLPRPYPLAAWQYTDGRVNGTAMPKAIPGIGPCDVSVIYRPDDMGLEVDDLTPAQKKELAAATAFLEALTHGIGQVGAPKKPATALGAGQRTAAAVKKNEGR